MDFKAIEQKLNKLEINTKENLNLVRDIRNILNSSPASIEFNENTFNVPDLLEGLTRSTGDKNVNNKT